MGSLPTILEKSADPPVVLAPIIEELPLSGSILSPRYSDLTTQVSGLVLELLAENRLNQGRTAEAEALRKQASDLRQEEVDESALPLPAQMFRMGAEMVAEKDPGFTYSLLSIWPINKQNTPRTDVEKAGLKKGDDVFDLASRQLDGSIRGRTIVRVKR